MGYDPLSGIGDDYPGLSDLMKYERRVVPATTFFIIWNPDYNAPPTATFLTREAAERSARKMAASYIGDRFFVCEAGGFAVVVVEEPLVAFKTLARGGNKAKAKRGKK